MLTDLGERTCAITKCPRIVYVAKSGLCSVHYSRRSRGVTDAEIQQRLGEEHPC